MADERSVQFEAEESAGDPSHFRVGDSVGVLYDPENPEDARLDARAGRGTSEAPVHGRLAAAAAEAGWSS